MSLSTESPVERRRRQNRSAQRTYRKTISARLEDVERRVERLASGQVRGALRESEASNSTASLDYDLHSQHLLPVLNGPFLVPPEIPSLSPSGLGEFPYPGHQRTLSHSGTEAPRDFPMAHGVEIAPSCPPFIYTGSVASPQDPGFGADFGSTNTRSLPYDGGRQDTQSSAPAGEMRLLESTHDNLSLVENADRRWTPLHHAVAYDHQSIVQALVNQGADVSLLNHNQQTALHLVAGTNNAKIASILLQAGSNPEIRDSNDQTVLDCAIVSGAEDVVELLLNRGVNTGPPNAF